MRSSVIRVLATAAAAAGLATGAVTAGTGPAGAATAVDGIRSGHCLAAGHTFTDQYYVRTGLKLSVRRSGNAVLTRRGTVIWQTRTSGSANRLCMRTDGNLVVHNAAGRVLWQSYTTGFTHDDVILDAGGEPVGLTIVHEKGGAGPKVASPWTSGRRAALYPGLEVLTRNQRLTSPDGRHTLRFGVNGALRVLHGSKVTWSAGTGGRGADFVAQAYLDGRYHFAVFTGSGRLVKNLATLHDAALRLTMRNDGDAVLTASGGRVLWSSHTAGR